MKEFFSFSKERPENKLSDVEEAPNPEDELTTQELIEELKSGGELAQRELSLLESFKSTSPKITKILALSTLLATTSADTPNGSDTKVGDRSEVRYVEKQSSEDELLTEENTVSYKEAHQSAEESRESVYEERRQKLLSQISGLTLNVAGEEGSASKHFSASDLASDEVIKLNGYISRIALYAQPGIDISVNGQELTTIEDLEDDQGRKFSFKNSSGLPVDGSETVVVKIDDDADDPIEIKFSHETFQKQGEVHVPKYEVDILGGDTLSSYIDTTHIASIGLDKREIEEIPDLKDKLRSAGYAVADVEATFETNVIDSLGVVGYNRDNAVMEYNDEKIMFFFKPYLSDKTADQIVMVARHEALHMLDYDRGYHAHDKVRELFADFHDFPEGSALREYVMDEGALDHNHENFNELKEDTVFNALDEDSFIFGAVGGHSWESTREFTATFLNTLHHLDNLPFVLSNLKHSHREEFINNYRRAINTFLEISRQKVENSSERFRPDIEFFKSKKQEFKAHVDKWRVTKGLPSVSSRSYYHE